MPSISIQHIVQLQGTRKGRTMEESGDKGEIVWWPTGIPPKSKVELELTHLWNGGRSGRVR